MASMKTVKCDVMGWARDEEGELTHLRLRNKANHKHHILLELQGTKSAELREYITKDLINTLTEEKNDG